MSLTSYRAAPPRVKQKWVAAAGLDREEKTKHALGRPGSDLLSRVLRRSTISAGAFHGRVRNGIGCSHPAITTRSAKGMFFEKLCLQTIFGQSPSLRPKAGAVAPRPRSVRPKAVRHASEKRWALANENDQANRAISTGKLHALLRFHTRPIDVVVSHGPLGESSSQGRFILGTASHLDAFSGYLYQTSLPGVAPGGTAGTRAVCPTRSSRTRVRAPQSSNAHDGYRPNCLTTF